jgi:hypothetical protein
VTDADKWVLSQSYQNVDLLNNGLIEVYNGAYQLSLNEWNGKSWFAQTYFSAICGGVDGTILAQRAANQVVNEIRWKWYDLIQPSWAPCPGCDTGYLNQDNDAITTNVTTPWGAGTTENLGGAMDNNQWTGPNYGADGLAEDNQYQGGVDYCMDVNQPNQGVGMECPSWIGRIPSEADANKALTMNVPDNVITAANRLNIATYTGVVSGGYWEVSYVWGGNCDM